MVATTRRPTSRQKRAPTQKKAGEAEQRMAGEVELAAGPTRSVVARLRSQGLTPDGQSGIQEKEKLSITLDKSLVEEIRAHFGQRALSTSINELLYVALAQERLGQLVDELEAEAGPASPEAYQRVLAQWSADE